MTALLTFAGPRPAAPLPAGFITPVLAFEFAETETEVRQILERPEGVVPAMDRVNRLDFLYIFLYGGCLLTFAMTCARLTGERLFYAAGLLAVGIMAADVAENLQLLGITARLNSDFGSRLSWLRLFTWLKWGGLALYFLLLRPYFRRQKGWFSVIGLVGLLPLLLGVLAFFSRGLPSELFALAIGLMFALLMLYSLRYQSAFSAQAVRAKLPDRRTNSE